MHSFLIVDSGVNSLDQLVDLDSVDSLVGGLVSAGAGLSEASGAAVAADKKLTTEHSKRLAFENEQDYFDMI